MKQLMMAVVIAALSGMALAEDTANDSKIVQAQCQDGVCSPCPSAKKQVAARRIRHEQMIAARKAAREAKLLPIIKKYGLDEVQAKALLAELEGAMRLVPVARPMPKREAKKVAPQVAE